MFFTQHLPSVLWRLISSLRRAVYIQEKRWTSIWRSYASTTERGLVCAFIAGLPEHAENLLQATTRVDDLPISEILARARAILKDSLTGTESAAAAAQLPGRQEKGVTALRRCYVCQEPNHMAQDCPRWHGSPRSPKILICYRCKRQGHIARNCPGNERVFSTSLSPRPHMNGALPAVSVQIDRVRQTALVDTGCTQTLVHKPCCQMWKKKQVPLLVVGGNSSMCCGESVVQIGIGNGPSVAVQALVVDEALFGYDLLLRLNAIRQLGGMTMSATGEVKFPQCERLMCAAITLNKPDFHAEYNEAKRVWTASWKWSGDQPPVSLKNRLSEYPAPKRLQGEYERELQAWIQNSWLIPYPESKLGPPKGLIPLMAILQESKQKVRPVMDYRELNEHVNAHTCRNGDSRGQKPP